METIDPPVLDQTFIDFKKEQNDKYNRTQAGKDSWLYRIFKNAGLDVYEKQNILKSIIADHKKKLREERDLAAQALKKLEEEQAQHG